MLGLLSDPSHLIHSAIHGTIVIKYSLKCCVMMLSKPERLLVAQHKYTRTVVHKNVWNCSSDLTPLSFQFKDLSISQICGQSLQPALSNTTAATLPQSMESKKTLGDRSRFSSGAGKAE